LNQHHVEPLGVNLSRWPSDIPYKFTNEAGELRDLGRAEKILTVQDCCLGLDVHPNLFAHRL
jgi:hypothetical protein